MFASGVRYRTVQHRRKHTKARERTGTRTGKRQWREKGPVGSCRWRRKAHTTRTGRARHAGTREAPTNAHGAGARTQAQARSGRRTVASEGVGDGGGGGNDGGEERSGGRGKGERW